MNIKKGKLNYDQSGRAYPNNPQINENWDCIWEKDGKHYKLVGDNEHKEWEEVDIYNQIIDEVYENYSKEYEKDNSIGLTLLVQRLDGKSVYRKPDKQMFIDLCTYDKTFSEKWGLKIEERELSLEERHQLALPIWKEKYGPLADMMVLTNVDNTPYKIPRKIITITYNNETIEGYE